MLEWSGASSDIITQASIVSNALLELGSPHHSVNQLQRRPTSVV